MRGHRGVLHNLSILTVGQVISQLANMAALVFLAKYLGAHWFGVVQVGVAFMAYAMITAEWGMMSLGVREISRLDHPTEILDYARAHLGVLALQTLAVLLVGLLVLPLLPFYHHDPVIFLLYLALILPQVYTQSWIAVGLERMTWVGIARITRSLVYALLIILLLPRLPGWTGQPAQRWVPAILLVAVVISNLTVNIPLARWFGRFVHPRLPNWTEIRARGRETAAIGANTVVLRILFNIDIIMLGVLSSPAVAGNYAAAARIVFFLVVAVEVLWAALLPRLSRLARESRPGFQRAFNLYLAVVTALLLPIACGGALLGPDIIALLYRGEFATAGPIFSVLAVSYAMLAAATFLGNTLLADDRQRWYFLPLLSCSLVAISGIFVFVPGHGGLGASWAMALAHGLLLAILLVLNRGHFSRLFWQTVAMCLPALGLLALVVTQLGTAPVLVRIAAGGGLYLAGAAWPLRRLKRLSP